jgi:hypothetical protein
MIGKEITFTPIKGDLKKSIGKPWEVPELKQRITWWGIAIKKLKLKMEAPFLGIIEQGPQFNPTGIDIGAGKSEAKLT